MLFYIFCETIINYYKLFPVIQISFLDKSVYGPRESILVDELEFAMLFFWTCQVKHFFCLENVFNLEIFSPNLVIILKNFDQLTFL